MTKEEKIFEAIGTISEERLAETEEKIPEEQKNPENHRESETAKDKKIVNFRRYQEPLEKIICACAVLCLIIVAGRRILPMIFTSGSSSSYSVDMDTAEKSAENIAGEAAAAETNADAISNDGSVTYLCNIDPSGAAVISISSEGANVQITDAKQIQRYLDAWNSTEIEILDESRLAEGTYMVTIYDSEGGILYKFAMDSAEGSEAYSVISGDLCFDKIEKMLQ